MIASKNKVKVGNKWYPIIRKINPFDYLDDNSKDLIKQIQIDLAPISELGGTAGEYDLFALFEGKVGSGKSNAANLFCLAIDNTFSPERIIYRDWHYWRIKAALTKDLHRDIVTLLIKSVHFWLRSCQFA